MAVSPDKSKVVRPGQRQVNRPKASVASGDGILAAAQGIVNFVYDYRIAFLVVIVAIFAAAGAASVWKSHQESKNLEGEEQIARITADLPGQNTASTIFGLAAPPEFSEDDKQKLVAAASRLEEVAREYDSFPSGIVAGLERGRLLAEADKYADAVAAYDALLQRHPDMNVAFRFRAMNGKAAAQLAAGHADEAVKTYQALVDQSKGVWREFALLDLAAAQESAGMKSEAIAVLERFTTEFPESVQLESAKSRLARLKGEVGTADERGNDVSSENTGKSE